MIMRGYYSNNLSGARLRQCYEIASPRVKQYLEAEIQFVLNHLNSNDIVLELGCGYGRVAFELAKIAKKVVGIDTSKESIALARELSRENSNCEFLEMDALKLAFDRSKFDMVVCIQNGICAFGVDKKRLVDQTLRITRPNGHVLFSTYSDQFWPYRLKWFEDQSELGLVGQIDYEKTSNGTIVCTDGFCSDIISNESFGLICKELGVDFQVTEIDNSSVFFEIIVPHAA